MLVLSRRMNEQIKIGRDITITIVRLKGNVVRVGIDAPKNVHIARSELLAKPKVDAEPTDAQAAATKSLRAAGAAGDDWPTITERDGDEDCPQEPQPLAVGPRSVSLAVRGAGPRQAPLARLVRRKHAMM